MTRIAKAIELAMTQNNARANQTARYPVAASTNVIRIDLMDAIPAIVTTNAQVIEHATATLSFATANQTADHLSSEHAAPAWTTATLIWPRATLVLGAETKTAICPRAAETQPASSRHDQLRQTMDARISSHEISSAALTCMLLPVHFPSIIKLPF